jgi:alkanesulfonate monooxygenase SsuD/methylene tetrahydromethanopterin reductase-like flavin-dependent oxidoreductase (luciferase family)
VEIPELLERGAVGLGSRPPRLLTGGMSGPAFVRMARSASGYMHGGGPPRVFRRAAEEARAAWIDAGRPGVPEVWGQAYFAFGDDGRGADYVRDYYAFTGAFADKVAAGLLTTPRQAVELVRGYAEAGCDHLVMLPAVPELDQLEQLGEVVAEALEPEPAR